MKRIVLAALVLGSMTAMSASLIVPGAHGTTNVIKHIDKAHLQQILYKRNGGKIKVPDTQKGSLVYVNAQKRAKDEWIQAQADYFASELQIAIAVKPGVFDLKKPTLQGDASLFIIDDPALPMSLVAPEAKWAMVNVAPLYSEQQQFFEARVKKELSRALAYLGGAAVSQYPNSLTMCVTKAEDLDSHVNFVLPFDIMRKIPEYIPGYGIKPFQLTTYRKACAEGWAPQPTNDVQKAIWKDVHQVPDKPITIEYDPKKGK